MNSLTNRLSLYKDFTSRKQRVRGLPIEIGIEMTNKCNLGCPFCAREEMVRPEGDMSMDIFRKIVDEVKSYAEIIYLHGDGEPFLHQNIYEAILYAKKNGLKVGVSTNGTTLNRKNAELLVETKIDYLIIAMDGVTKETYEKLRLYGKFEEVVDNVKGFLELSRESGADIFTIIQFIEMDENRHESKAFYEYWKTHKPDVIRIKPYVDLLEHSKKTHFNKPCFYLWRQTMIDWDGTVFPCCVDTNSKHRLGNIAEKSLAEIWNDTPILEMRGKHVRGEMNQIDICDTCDMPILNNMAIFGASLIDGCTSKKILPYVENLASLYKGFFDRNGHYSQKGSLKEVNK